MLIQWCLKGISESQEFNDDRAREAADFEGLTSSWLRSLGSVGKPITFLPPGSHAVLSQSALDAHVNGFSGAAATTPYLSLSAGCVELDPSTQTTTTYAARLTALDFATNGGSGPGYIFYLWVLVSPKPAPELPGFGEEVRELNIFRQFTTFHHEGEIAAKLFVPARQIQKVEKYGSDITLQWTEWNSNFVPPERVSNVLGLI
jgi:hypothetical protein